MMNFKDEYRAANNEIHGDRSILTGITNEKPKKIIYFKPVLGTVVAAAVCLVTFLAYPYIINPSTENGETPSKTYPDVFVASEQTEGQPLPDTEQTATYKLSRTMAPEETAEPETESAEYDYRSAKVAIEDESAIITDSTATDSAELYTFTAEESAEIDDTTSDSVFFEENTATNAPLVADKETAPEAASAAGGGGSSSAGNSYTCVRVTEDTIVVNHPEKGEITLKITEDTVIINNADGEPLSKDALQPGQSLQVLADGEIIFKIIVIK